MNTSLYIAKRYLRSKSSNNAINIITYIALAGVILGAASLFIVLSGFAGLKDFTLQFSSIIDPDLKAETTIGKSFILTDEEISKLNNIDEIVLYSKIIEERAIVTFDGKNYPTILKGVDEDFEKVVAIDSIIEYGNWIDQKSNQIMVGYGIAHNLSMGVLDYAKSVNIIVPKPGKGQISSIKNAVKSIKTVNVGIFSVNEKLDDSYIFTPISLTKHLLNYKKNQISALEFKLKEDADETITKQKIKEVLGDHHIIIKNKDQLNDALYKMLNGENLLIYLLLTLVSSLLIFNVMGSIIMMILEKKQSLNTLFNLGLTIKKIRHIFFIHGSVITIVGATSGLLIALIIVIIQKIFGLVPITPSLAYPMSILLENFLIVFLTISVLGIIASKIASVRITKSLVKNY